MAAHRLRVAFDANVIIAGIRLPRWPHEVMRATLTDTFDLILPEQVIVEARRHLPLPSHAVELDRFLFESGCRIVPMPPPDLVAQHHDSVRSEKDVPIALALLASDVEVFVTNDKDFTEPGATAPRFRERIRVMLPAVFLRQVMGWDAEMLEAIRHRTWADLIAGRTPPLTDSQPRRPSRLSHLIDGQDCRHGAGYPRRRLGCVS